MPGYRIRSSKVSLALYDVVGEDGGDGFIRHVGLAATAGERPAQKVEIIDMGRPCTEQASTSVLM